MSHWEILTQALRSRSRRCKFRGVTKQPVVRPPQTPVIFEPSTPILGRLWIHGIFLGVLLVGLMPLLNNSYPAVVDEAVYSYQAANLASGSWASPRPLPDIDTDGLYSALSSANIQGQQWIPYSRQPLYPVALAPLYRIGGYSALFLLSLLGTWTAAMTAAGIARRFDPIASLATLWFVGIGTPLLFDAYIIVAHSLAAGMAGLSAYALLNAWERSKYTPADSNCGRMIMWTIVATVSAIILVLVRSEGALFAGSAAAIGTLLGVHLEDRLIRADWGRIAPALCVGLAGCAAYILNGSWARSITSANGSGAGSMDRATDPLAQAWASLIRPWGLDNRLASAAMTLMIICTLIAAITFRLFRSRPLISVLFLCAAAAAGIARHLEPVDVITGFLPATPVMLFGLLLLGRMEFDRLSIQFLLGSSILTAGGILWFAYGAGGATEWGGRFYHILIPLIAPVSIVCIRRRFADLAPALRIASLSALAVLTLSISALSLRTIVVLRAFNHDIVQQTVALTSKSAGRPIVAVAPVNPNGLSRAFWAEVRDGYPVVNGVNLAVLAKLLPLAAANGHSEVLVVTDTSPRNVDTVITHALRRLDSDQRWSVTGASALGNTGYIAVTIQKE